MEIWKTIEDYPNYEVSNLGNIKSLNYRMGKRSKILKPKAEKSGHQRVQLVNENGKKPYLVHRLVAQAFIANPDNLPFINHKDENPSNNCVDNLEWCTPKYNCNYGTRNRKIVEKNKIKITQLNKDGEFIKEWDSLTDASKILNISLSDICSCCGGKLKTAGGYKWKYN